MCKMFHESTSFHVFQEKIDDLAPFSNFRNDSMFAAKGRIVNFLHSAASNKGLLGSASVYHVVSALRDKQAAAESLGSRADASP